MDAIIEKLVVVTVASSSTSFVNFGSESGVNNSIPQVQYLNLIVGGGVGRGGGLRHTVS